MFENKNKLKYINLKNLLNNHLINDDPNKKDIYSIKNNIIENSKNKIQILNNNLKFDKRNIIIAHKIKKRNKSSFFNTNINIKKNISYNNISLLLKRPFVDKIKDIVQKENKNFREVNTFPFNFENLNYLNTLKNRESTKKEKNVLIKSNFKRKILYKYSFPKIENELIKVYNKIIYNIKTEKENNDINFNKTRVKTSFSNNLNIFTNYIKQNVNEIINKRINYLKKNKSEDKICNNYYNNNGKKDIKFNVVLLDNWNNIKINGYNPLNNYSIFQIKTEINDLKMKNKIFKKYHIYNKKSSNNIVDSNKSLTQKKPFKIKKNLSFEKLIKEKSNNIFFDEFSLFGKIPEEIMEKNNSEIKAFLNILYLSSKLDEKTKKLNETIKNGHDKIESNMTKIKSKTSQIIDNFNNVSSITNNLTDNILLHNCKERFSKIQLRSSINKINELKNKFQQKSKETKNEEIEGIEIKKTYDNQILILKNEIKNIENKIKENKESGIKYYLNILKEGEDNRNVGLTWVVKRLLRLEYFPQINDFPYYINKKMYDYFIENAKNKNIILDCLQELGEIKKIIFSDKGEEKDEFDDLYEYKEKNSNQDNLLIKLKRLLESYSFWSINPEIKMEFDYISSNKITKQYETRKFLNKKKIIKNKLQLKRNNTFSFLEKNKIDIKYNNKKEIINLFNRVTKLKDIIQNAFLILDDLKNDIIKYIKSLLISKNKIRINNENFSLLIKNMDGNSVKIIRNLIGNEDKLKDIHKLII